MDGQSEISQSLGGTDAIHIHVYRRGSGIHMDHMYNGMRSAHIDIFHGSPIDASESLANFAKIFCPDQGATICALRYTLCFSDIYIYDIFEYSALMHTYLGTDIYIYALCAIHYVFRSCALQIKVNFKVNFSYMYISVVLQFALCAIHYVFIS